MGSSNRIGRPAAEVQRQSGYMRLSAVRAACQFLELVLINGSTDELRLVVASSD